MAITRFALQIPSFTFPGVTYRNPALLAKIVGSIER